MCAFAEDKYESLHTAILIGDAAADLTAGALSVVAFGKLLGGPGSVALAAVFIIVVVLLFGEITPRCIAAAVPEKLCFLVWPVLRLFYWVLTPFRLLFGGYAKLLAKAFKVKKEDSVTEEELRSIVDEAEEDGTLREDESELVRSALEFDDLKVEDILVPRVDVVAVREDSSMEEILATFRENRYSRLPVYREKIDDVVGLIHERDFYDAYLKGEKTIGHVVQNIVFTTDYARVSSLLKQLQREKIHMAAVLDEYGGLVGIVTLEDILEELVGEIWDEHDEESVLYGKIADGEYWADGKCDLGEFLGLVRAGGGRGLRVQHRRRLGDGKVRRHSARGRGRPLRRRRNQSGQGGEAEGAEGAFPQGGARTGTGREAVREMTARARLSVRKNFREVILWKPFLLPAGAALSAPTPWWSCSIRVTASS